jgi:CheY-like chemotaxis protein
MPVMWADPHQLHQVVVNLIANAHQALRRHGPPRHITVLARHDEATGRAVLDVVDTGPGILPDVQGRIFEPFFTTKPSGEGTGLGLSLCRGIVQEHGGTLTLAASSEAGTTFRIELPVVAPPPSAFAAAAARRTPRPLPPHLVLIVDDEEALAEVVAEAVQRDGHTAGIAANGAMALEMLAREAYDLVISDTKMPLLDGETFYAEIQRRFPRLRERIIFLTGDVLSPDKREFLERTGAPYLTKPCDLDEIRRTVRCVLAGEGGRPR